MLRLLGITTSPDGWYRACCAYARKPEFSLNGGLFSIYFVQHWVQQQIFSHRIPRQMESFSASRSFQIWWFPCPGWVKTMSYLYCTKQDAFCRCFTSYVYLQLQKSGTWSSTPAWIFSVKTLPRRQIAIFSVTLRHAVDKKNPIQSPQAATTPRNGGINGTT